MFQNRAKISTSLSHKVGVFQCAHTGPGPPDEKSPLIRLEGFFYGWVGQTAGCPLNDDQIIFQSFHNFPLGLYSSFFFKAGYWPYLEYILLQTQKFRYDNNHFFASKCHDL